MWDLSEFRTEENPIDTLGALGADLSLYFYIWCQWLSDSMWNGFSCCIMVWSYDHFFHSYYQKVMGVIALFALTCKTNLFTLKH